MTFEESSDNKKYGRRFSYYRITEHLGLMVLFTLLAATGLSQKFHSLGISHSLIIGLGGIDSVRVLHHVSAVLLTALAVQHIFVNFAGVGFRQWEPSMLVTLNDAQSALHNVRYYLGLADRPTGYGKYNYKEKFVYWLVLSGGVQMIVTGFVLWFPVAATGYLPGQFIPASKVVHSNEAMLIFLLIVVWHTYDSVLSPDVFPLNKSIFTGFADERQGPQD
jgi:formate dehydrogenase subunit gamma